MYSTNHTRIQKTCVQECSKYRLCDPSVGHTCVVEVGLDLAEVGSGPHVGVCVIEAFGVIDLEITDLDNVQERYSVTIYYN